MFEDVISMEDIYGAEISEADRAMINLLNEEIGADDDGAQFDAETDLYPLDLRSNHETEIDALLARF